MNRLRRDILKALFCLPLATLSGTATSRNTQTGIRINLPGPRSLPFLPLELITALGIDNKFGVKLLIRYFPSGVRALEDMLAGNAHFSAQAFTVLYAFHFKGKKVQAIAPLNGQAPPYGIVARKELQNQIKSIADLRGRSIGVSVGSPTSKTYLQQVTEVFLAANGIKPDEVRWVPTAQNWDGQFGALSSGSVDAVFCEEPFVSGLARKNTGFLLSDFNDPKIAAKIPGAGHLRAALTTSTDILERDPELVEIMVRMLNQSLEWMSRTAPREIINHIGLQSQEEKEELIEVLTRQHGMYARDVRFSRSQIKATAQFMKSAGILADPGFDINTLINHRHAGVKP